MKTFYVYLVVFCILFISNTSVISKDYSNTIAPEVLEEFDQDIIKGNWPKIVRITQPMLWDLRKNQDQGGDVYTFDLEPSKLSTAQKKIILKWIQGGAEIFLSTQDQLKKYLPLFDTLYSVKEYESTVKGSYEEDGLPQIERFKKKLTLLRHPVNTDISDIIFFDKESWYWGGENYAYRCKYIYLEKYPANTEIIGSLNEGPVLGKMPYGRGNVYFISKTKRGFKDGGDKDRFILNFYQWMKGKNVPGYTYKKSTGFDGDMIILKDGDIIDGNIMSIKIKTEDGNVKNLLRSEIEDIKFKK